MKNTPRHKLKEVEEKKAKQQTEHDEFEKQRDNKYKAVAKTVKLSGRDNCTRLNHTRCPNQSTSFLSREDDTTRFGFS